MKVKGYNCFNIYKELEQIIIDLNNQYELNKEEFRTQKRDFIYEK